MILNSELWLTFFIANFKQSTAISLRLDFKEMIESWGGGKEIDRMQGMN